MNTMNTIAQVIAHHEVKIRVLSALQEIDTKTALNVLAELICELDPQGVATANEPPVITQQPMPEAKSEPVPLALNQPVKKSGLNPGWKPTPETLPFKTLKFLHENGPSTSKLMAECLKPNVSSGQNQITAALCMLRERGFVHKPTKKNGPWTLDSSFAPNMLAEPTSEVESGESSMSSE